MVAWRRNCRKTIWTHFSFKLANDESSKAIGNLLTKLWYAAIGKLEQNNNKQTGRKKNETN